MTIESDRLLFRPYADDDLPFLASLLSNPEVMRYIGDGHIRDEEGATKFLHWIYSMYEMGPATGLMVLERKRDGVAIGHAGIVPQMIAGAFELEIGYWLAPAFWGQGYATEAASALRDYGKSELNQDRFIALIQPGNTASQKVAQRIGMSVDKKVNLNGQDVLVYATV